MVLLPPNPYFLIDITQPLHENVPSWEDEIGFKRTLDTDYDLLFRTETFWMRAGIGTHMDAPSHYVPGGKNIEGIDIENLFLKLVCLPCNPSLDPDFKLKKKDIEEYEASFGAIKEGSFVLVSTGWHQFWENPKKYRNEDETKKMHFPGVALEAAELLLEKKIAGLGIDTLSSDGGDYSCPVHKLLLSANIFLVENIADCQKVPSSGAYIMLMPLKIRGATEAPIRAVVFI
jgi:kynurenine formamidase